MEQSDEHKGFKAKWDGVSSDSDTSNQSEKANLCFMAIEDSSHEVTSQSTSCSDYYDDDDWEKLKMIEALSDKQYVFYKNEILQR